MGWMADIHWQARVEKPARTQTDGRIGQGDGDHLGERKRLVGFHVRERTGVDDQPCLQDIGRKIEEGQELEIPG